MATSTMWKMTNSSGIGLDRQDLELRGHDRSRGQLPNVPAPSAIQHGLRVLDVLTPHDGAKLMRRAPIESGRQSFEDALKPGVSPSGGTRP
jgi:hypothetical protein